MKSAFTIARARSCLYVLALTVLPAAYAAHPIPELAPVQNLYLLPMSHGFDQYLANHLTQTGRFRIVTDPKFADAILTDTLGPVFDASYNQLYPPPKAAKPKSDTTDKKQSQIEAARDTIEQKSREDQQFRSSTFGRGRGNLFLVMRTTKYVVWSAYKRPKNSKPDELDKLAGQFASQLRKQAGEPVTSTVAVDVPQPESPAAAAPASAPPVSEPPAAAHPASAPGAPAPAAKPPASAPPASDTPPPTAP
jgi:hypothetical protein